ncbi:MAG: heat-inducible transcription repressor HrcA [Solirubrobacteraceae bacterium]|nr:heat-inducible transcription repressor HrcA [Solirubrobacteraceae bacterium]
MLTPRQEQVLRKVIQTHQLTAQPVGSKALAEDPELGVRASTIRNDLAQLEEHGLLAHPHTSAGRVPTDSGYRYFVDKLLPEPVREPGVDLSLVRMQVDEAMRMTTETLSQVTDLLAIVSAPPIDTSTIRHIEVLSLQPRVVMVVVITSTGGVSKRVFSYEESLDPGLVTWAGEYLNERLVGTGLGARTLRSRVADPSLSVREQAFLATLAPAFTALAETAEDTLYVDGAARLLSEHRVQDVSQINELMTMLERRVSLLELLRAALGERDVMVSIGEENAVPALRSLAIVAAGYGLPQRALGTVSVIGPVTMDYPRTIGLVRDVAGQLSRFVTDVYDEA